MKPQIIPYTAPLETMTGLYEFNAKKFHDISKSDSYITKIKYLSSWSHPWIS